MSLSAEGHELARNDHYVDDDADVNNHGAGQEPRPKPPEMKSLSLSEEVNNPNVASLPQEEKDIQLLFSPSTPLPTEPPRAIPAGPPPPVPKVSSTKDGHGGSRNGLHQEAQHKHADGYSVDHHSDHHEGHGHGEDKFDDHHGSVSHVANDHHHVAGLEFDALDGPISPSHIAYQYATNFYDLNGRAKFALDQFGLRPHLFAKFFMMMGIGAVVGLVSWCLHYAVVYGMKYEIDHVQSLFDEHYANPEDDGLARAWTFSILWSLFFGLLSSIMVVYIKPQALGPGVPEVISYLNGVDIPEINSVSTFFVKLFSVVCVNLAMLPVGMEGPIIHIGAMVGGGISQGRSKSEGCRIDNSWLSRFRLTDYRRDFTTAGVAAGVAAAFLAPIGGLLFTFEEVATQWTKELMVMVLICCLVSTLLNQVLSGLAYGTFPDITGYTFVEYAHYGGFSHLLTFGVFPASILIGILCGLLGSLWTAIHLYFVRLRTKLWGDMASRWQPVIEVAVLCIVYSSIVLALTIGDECTPVNDNWSYKQKDKLFQGTCSHDYYTPIGSVLQGPLSYRLVLMFSSNSSTPVVNNVTGVETWENMFELRPLVISLLMFWVFSCLATGTATCPDLGMPNIFIGSIVGRIVGVIIFSWGWFPCDQGILALVGAGCMFSCISRQVLCVTVILLEMGGDVNHMFPIMMGTVVAKWVADLFGPSLYHVIISYKDIAFLPNTFQVTGVAGVTVKEVCNKDLVYLPVCVQVKDLMEILVHPKNTHQGFPVVLPRYLKLHHAEQRAKPFESFMATTTSEDENKTDWFGNSIESFGKHFTAVTKPKPKKKKDNKIHKRNVHQEDALRLTVKTKDTKRKGEKNYPQAVEMQALHVPSPAVAVHASTPAASSRSPSSPNAGLLQRRSTMTATRRSSLFRAPSGNRIKALTVLDNRTRKGRERNKNKNLAAIDLREDGVSFHDEEVFGGIILRSQLMVILDHPRCFMPHNTYELNASEYVPWVIPYERFMQAESELYFKDKEYDLREDELERWVDLSPYINASAVTVPDNCELHVAYNIFKSLGLRHLCVLNDRGNVMGMVTRHELDPHGIQHNLEAERERMKKAALSGHTAVI